MKTQILRESLKKAVAAVERATAKNPTLPTLGAIALVAKKNNLELSATDLEIGIRYKLLAKTEEEGGVVVPVSPFSQLVSVLPEKEITLVLEKGALKIESKEHQTSLKTFPSDDFPIIPSLKGDEKSIEVEMGAFCEGLDQVVSIPGQNQTRPEISGVFIVIQKERIKIVATDSFRLAEKNLNVVNAQNVEASFILPQKTAREIIGIFGGLPGKMKLYISPTQVLFDCSLGGGVGHSSVQIVSRLIEGEYPHYQDVIPRDFITKVRVVKQEFISRIKAAAVFSGKMQDTKLAVDPKKKGLEISAESAETGRHSSFLSANVTGESLEISFNWRFLLEGLSNIKGEEVEIGFGGEDKPILMRPLNKEQYLYVVMPVKA